MECSVRERQQPEMLATIKRSLPLRLLLFLLAATTLLWHVLGKGPSGDSLNLPTFVDDSDTLKARNLLNRNLYAGLDPEYAASLRGKDVRPDFAHYNVAEGARTLDMDFRKPIIARPEKRALHDTFRGTECRAHYTEKICPAPGQCPAPYEGSGLATDAVAEKGACVEWRRGILPKANRNPFRGIDQPITDRTPLELQKWDTDGVWRDPYWIPSKNAEGYRFFSATDMHECFAGKRILIQGDSMMRQFFARIVQFSRSIPASVEYAHQAHAAYIVHGNGSDTLDLPRSDDLTQYDVSSTMFTVYYNWMPASDLTQVDGLLSRWYFVRLDCVPQSTDIPALDPDHVVIGFNYWYGDGHDFTPLPNTFETFWNSTTWNGTISYYAVPDMSPNTKPWALSGRNAIMRTFAADRSRRAFRRFHMIPTDRMSAAADLHLTPQRNCAHWPMGENKCLWDAHWSGFSFLPKNGESLNTFSPWFLGTST